MTGFVIHRRAMKHADKTDMHYSEDTCAEGIIQWWYNLMS